MKSPLLYLLEVLFCSGLLMAFYRLLLMRKVSFALCRRYLVAAVVLSAVIPALNIPLYPAQTVVYPLPLIAPTPVEVPAGEVFADEFQAAPLVTGSADMPATDWNAVAQKTIWGIYALTAVVLSVLVVVRIISVRRLRRRATLTDCGRYTLAEHPDVASPFSFLRTVFLGDGFEGRRREIVLHHEASHVVHRHSAERIVVETVRCLFWFNPFVWMAARWLQEVQEWEADHDVLEAGYDLTEYRIIIFHQLFGYNPDIACGLNHSLTKDRFAMMTHFKESRFALVRLGAAIPIVAGMMMLCSFTTRTPDPGDQQHATASAVAPAAALPGLETLKPIPIHIKRVGYTVGGKFELLDFLPVDDSKYKYVNGTVTDLKGKDISWWAQKHYYVQSKNPVFVIDGVKMNKDEYVAYAEAQRKEKGNRHVSSERTETLYAGPEVGKLLGDAAVDALVVVTTEPKIAGGFVQLPNLSIPLRGEYLGKYGARTNPVTKSPGMHTGCDIMAASGTPVAAAADGTVAFAGNDGGWGNTVRIAHANGYSSTYAHLAAISVKEGESVKGGSQIGTVGATGRATGPHLHFELARNKQPFNPEQVFDFKTGTLVAASHAAVAKPGVAESKAAMKRLDAVIGGTITSEGPTAGDTYTVVGKLEVVFKGLPELKISCDTMICYPERVECRGDASMKDGKGNTFFGQCFEFSKNAAGELEWRARKVNATAQTAMIHISADKIVFNGKPITKEQLLSKIGEWRESLPAEKRPDMAITLKADQQTKMGVVTDVKDQLRKAGQLRVNYFVEDSPEAVVRMLPPPADMKTMNGVKVFPSGDVTIKERNLFTVAVNGSGDILAGPRDNEQIVSADKLAAMVETFVANASDNRNLPEKQTREFILPNGRTVTYPVSEGVVSLMIARDTPYPVFIDVQRRISAGFNEIRGTVAQKWFGKSYSALDETQRQLVVRAVPLNIAEAETHD